ncbi:MAG: PQQ-binding-like beta-propeller repeat protein [Planctomycetales bacterium]|nr:PQQ-binding-like beta-propeller repeat protein [Planctomycetales bacterium]
MHTEQTNERYGSAGYQSAVGVAIVAAVFGVLVAILLAVQVYHAKTTDPARAIQLETMKEKTKANPADTTLAQAILELDAQIRRDQLARLYFLRRGTILLVVTLVLCIGSVLWAEKYRSKQLSLEPLGDIKVRQIQQARRIRTAFTITLVMGGMAALFWAFYTPDSERAAAQDVEVADSDIESDTDRRMSDAGPATMDDMMAQWPTFRGPGGLGVCRFENIPQEWDAAAGKNILWKSPVPLGGNNSPIVWGDRVFLTGATKDRQQVFCFDAQTGRMLWAGDVSIPRTPQRQELDIMEDTGYAANTAVTDGRRVCAIFAGGDVGCFTADGKPLWEKHLGIPESAYGYAASLAAFENLVIIQWDVGYEGDQSKLIALDWQTGQTAWETKRPVPNSWASPTVARVDGQWRILTAGSPFVIAYDPKTGAEQFRVHCIEGDIAATPIAVNDRIFVIEPYNKLVAVNAKNAQGDVTATHILWQAEASMPDICSPVSNGRFVWTLTSEGGLSCFDTADGSPVYTHDLGIPFQASPALVGEVLYLLGENGTMILAQTGTGFTEIGRNELGETCHASPVFGSGRIYIRTVEHLFCIGLPD